MRYTKLFTYGFAAAFALASTAQARTFGLELSGGYNTYAMGDVNKGLGNAATSIGATVSNINGGFQGGVAVDYGINTNFQVNAGIDYLTASSSFSANGETINVTAPDLSLGIGGAYVVPVLSNVDVKGLVRLSYEMLSGASFAASGPFSVTTTLTGSGFGAQVGAGADYFFSDNVSLGVVLAYRYAKLSPITGTSNGTSSTQTNNDGSNLSVDYSGLASKLVLSYWFF